MQEQVNRNSTKAMRAQTIKKENGHQTREACTIAPFLLFAQKAIVLKIFILPRRSLKHALLSILPSSLLFSLSLSTRPHKQIL